MFTKPLCCALYWVLYLEVGAVCKVSGSCAAGCSAAGPGLRIPTSPVVSVMGLVFLEQQRSLGPSGVIKNSLCVLALTSLEG